jgi:hypothetical protein
VSEQFLAKEDVFQKLYQTKYRIAEEQETVRMQRLPREHSSAPCAHWSTSLMVGSDTMNAGRAVQH